MPIIPRRVGMGTICDESSMAEGLCDPLLGPADFSVTTVAASGGEDPPFNPFPFLAPSGETISPEVQAMVNAAYNANRIQPGAVGGIRPNPNTPIPGCSFNNLTACGNTAASFISRHSGKLLLGLFALFVLRAPFAPEGNIRPLGSRRRSR